MKVMAGAGHYAQIKCYLGKLGMPLQKILVGGQHIDIPHGVEVTGSDDFIIFVRKQSILPSIAFPGNALEHLEVTPSVQNRIFVPMVFPSASITLSLM